MSVQDMRFKLTTPAGKIMGFYLEGIARLYHGIWGGTLIDTQKERGSITNTIPQDKRVA